MPARHPAAGVTVGPIRAVAIGPSIRRCGRSIPAGAPATGGRAPASTSARPGYWGGWPYAWGAAYALPYAVAPIVVNSAPPAQVIVQPAQIAQEAPATSYWYYCTQPAGYFPYVQNCSQPWMKVVPQVPGRNDSPPQLAP